MEFPRHRLYTFRLAEEQELAADNLSLVGLTLSSLYYIIAFLEKAFWHLVFAEVVEASRLFDGRADVQTCTSLQKSTDRIDERLY